MYRRVKQGRLIFLLLGLFTAGLVFAVPQVCAEALQQGLALCGGPLLVSLFPFLVVSALVMQSGAAHTLGRLLWPVVRLIGLEKPGAGGVLLIGLVGGFAPAAVAASEAVRTGELTPAEASALLPACICSGPSFVILTVGEQMLGSRSVGICLFAAQVLAGWLTAALLYRLSGQKCCNALEQALPPGSESAPTLDGILTQAVSTYVKLCGFVLYFRLLAAGCKRILPAALAPFPAMLLEVCSGCDAAARTGLWASGLCCAALSIQGVSVLMQVRTICPKEISFRPLLWGRAVHLPLSLALFYLGLPEKAVETFQTLCTRMVPMQRVPTDCALLVFFVCCITACELCHTTMPQTRKKHSAFWEIAQNAVPIEINEGAKKDGT